MAYNVKQFIGAPSTFQFYVPPTLQSDFINLCNTDIPNFTYTFELIRDWSERPDEEENRVMLRGTYFPINWKSKMGNSDVNRNFKCPYTYEIHKGDILIKEDGEYLMVNWDVQHYPNNQATQAVTCNLFLKVDRLIPKKADSRGYIIEPEHTEVIVENVPSSWWEYASRPDYQVNFNTPGILPDATIVGHVQYNSLTKNIDVNDEFYWGKIKYRIINVDLTETNISLTKGLLKLTARRIGGDKV